jgi:hypothetical protein
MAKRSGKRAMPQTRVSASSVVDRGPGAEPLPQQGTPVDELFSTIKTLTEAVLRSDAPRSPACEKIVLRQQYDHARPMLEAVLKVATGDLQRAGALILSPQRIGTGEGQMWFVPEPPQVLFFGSLVRGLLVLGYARSQVGQWATWHGCWGLEDAQPHAMRWLRERIAWAVQGYQDDYRLCQTDPQVFNVAMQLKHMLILQVG